MKAPFLLLRRATRQGNGDRDGRRCGCRRGRRSGHRHRCSGRSCRRAGGRELAPGCVGHFLSKLLGRSLNEVIQEVVAVLLKRLNADPPPLDDLHLLFAQGGARLVHEGHETAELQVGLCAIVDAVPAESEIRLHQLTRTTTSGLTLEPGRATDANVRFAASKSVSCRVEPIWTICRWPQLSVYSPLNSNKEGVTPRRRSATGVAPVQGVLVSCNPPGGWREGARRDRRSCRRNAG